MRFLCMKFQALNLIGQNLKTSVINPQWLDNWLHVLQRENQVKKKELQV